MQAFRMMGKLYATPVMQAVSSDPFPASYSERVRKVGVVNTKNKLITAGIGCCLTARPRLEATSSATSSPKALRSRSDEQR